MKNDDDFNDFSKVEKLDWNQWQSFGNQNHQGN
jgi:hypothetical protein